MMPVVYIHVGFMSTGTTSLQRNFFSQRDDLLYVGEPYGRLGGIFTNVRSVEDFKYDVSHIKELCDEFIYSRSAGRKIIVSDEALSDTPELYFAPYAMPRDTIALRLSQLFPHAKIIFTIRDQRQYVASMYLNLKRNAAFFDRLSLPPFPQWFAGMLSQVRCNYMQNMNFLECVGLYTSIFGRENVCVLPFETLTHDGVTAYLGKLCAFMDIELTANDVANYATVQNRRMSTRWNEVAELLGDDRFHRLYSDFIGAFGKKRVEAFLDDAPPAAVAVQPAQEAEFRRRAGTGNWALARFFALDLERYGYVVAAENDLDQSQLARFEEQMTPRSQTSPRDIVDDRTVEWRVNAQVATMRARLVELERLRRSPSWRVVAMLSQARRAFGLL